MIKVSYLLLCESHTLDTNRRYSLINIFDCLTFEEFPARPERVSVAFLITAKPNELEDEVSLKIDFLNPSKQTILSVKGKGVKEPEDPTDPDKRLKIAAVVDVTNGLSFIEAGTYKYQLYLNNKLIETKELEVLVRMAV